MIVSLLIAISLSFDSFATAIGLALKNRGNVFNMAVVVSGIFALCQTLMAFLGYMLGNELSAIVSGIDHWIALILLNIVGVKFIFEAFNGEKEHEIDKINWKTIIILGIATSIDAFIVGVTFVFMELNVLEVLLFIAIITFMFSFSGFMMGKRFSQSKSEKVEVLGGLVLIAIGLKIFLTHVLGGN